MPRRAAAVAVLLASACTSAGGSGGYRGAVLPRALPRPDFTLTATDGAPYRFAERTRGQVTFLFFGYTNCPDVCPVHMANIAASLQHLTHEDRDRVSVVFVTTDPSRDSLPRLRQWLAGFDPTFVGLRGDDSTVARIESGLLLAPSVREPGDSADPGAYGVGHAAQVLAFTPDDSLHVVYPFGTRQEDWGHDLPLLLHGDWSGR
jgi:protein SCO1/2